MKNAIQATAARLLPEAQKFLCDLMRYESTPGNEQGAMEFCAREFAKLDVTVEKIPLSDAIKDDPDYSWPVPDIRYGGRFNLRVVRKGSGGGK